MSKPITINLATYPKTRRYCEQVLNSLRGIKCDAVRVYLNEYTEVPDEFPKDEKFHYHIGEENIMDSGKFYFMRTGEYYFTIDDDFIYTQSYFTKSLRFMQETGCVAVTTYGKALKPKPQHFMDAHTVIPWNEDEETPYICNVASTGLSLYDTDKVFIHSNYFKYHGMTDLEIARMLQDKKFPIICRPHTTDEIEYIAGDYHETLWDRREELYGKHAEILNSIPEWKLYEHKKVLWLTNYIHSSLINEEKITRSGQYLWIRALGSDVKRWAEIINKESIKSYDIIHMNLAPNDLDLALEVRAILGKDSETKLICQADHSVDIMNGAFNFQLLKQALNAADYVMGVEEYQIKLLKHLTDKPVLFVHNPIDIDFVRGVAKAQQENRIGVISHNYLGNEAYVAQAFYDKRYPVDLLFYQGDDAIRLMKTYTNVYGSTDYLKYLQLLTQYKVLVDTHLSYSIGRSCMDAAALGIPMICSERSESAKYLYPDTLVNPYDVGRISELTDRLMSDIVFYKEVAETAHERAKEFDLYRLKDKLLEGIFNLKN